MPTTSAKPGCYGCWWLGRYCGCLDCRDCGEEMSPDEVDIDDDGRAAACGECRDARGAA